MLKVAQASLCGAIQVFNVLLEGVPLRARSITGALS